MDQIAKNLPEIIKQSAASPLGILALMIIALAILAFFFFKRSSEKARIAIFVMLFLGVAALAGVIMRQSKIVAAQTANNQPGNSDPRQADPPKPDPGPGPTPAPKPTSPPTANKLSLGVSASTDPVTAGAGTYKILSTKLNRISDDNFSLSFQIRYTRGNDQWAGQNFMGEDFRLLVDDVPTAPTTAPNELVAVNSARDGTVSFTIPDTTKSLALKVGQPGHDFSTIPIQLKAK